jgi:hypothetical protein
LTNGLKRCCVAGWLGLVLALAALHALNLRADFPNHSPWFSDWAKYTDEGWFGNAAVRAHLFGNWYVAGDFNPAVALPLWPALEWLLFCFTGVTVEAARGLAVGFFFVNLALSYLLVRANGPRWAGLLAVMLLAASPFIYCFSRLAILEPLLMTLLLTALNVAVRAGRARRPMVGAAGIGLLFTLMMLTKTTAIFLLPALAWALLLALKKAGKPVVRCALAAGVTFAVLYGAWMGMLAHFGLMADYNFLYFVNDYPKPKEFYWPLASLWWSFHGGLWVDWILISLTGVVTAGAVAARRSEWGRRLVGDPVFGACVLGVAGYILFMTYQNHPQPRYFAMVAFLSFILVAKGAAAMLEPETTFVESAGAGPELVAGRISARALGWAVIGLAALAAAIDGAWTLRYALHLEYTFVDAAQQLTHYIDAHPNGKRLLLSISGDEIGLITHLPALCDDFVTPSAQILDLPTKIGHYQPGWYASWNDLDPYTLEDLHTHYSLEQVASFPAFDDPDRNVLVLFKLHPLAGGAVRPNSPALGAVMAGDKIDVPIE